MNKLIARVGATAGAALTAGMLLAPAALADDGNTCTITDNGAFSHNRCRIKVVNKSATVQINVARVKNRVITVSNTGGNKASFNTGDGDVSIDTGDSTVTVTITNNVNSNAAPPPGP
ncbi:MAG TPA: hypothetical protein VIH52_03045 [Candidatus Nanoarchaeia archaeon]|nr:hypothetical protein [uncultured archaeon]